MSRRVLVPVSHPLGGIRTYMLYCFKPLLEQGYTFTFLSESGGAFHSFQEDVASWPGTKFIETARGSGSRGVFSAVRKALASREIDLIHSQGLKAGAEAGLANYFKQIPHLITLHDVILPENDIPGRFKWIKRTIIGLATRRASVIVPVSKDCEENHLTVFPQWRRGPVRMNTIFNGIDLDRIDQALEQYDNRDSEMETIPGLSDRFGYDKQVVLAGFFGRFMPQKGFDVLLQSLKILAQRGYSDRFRLIATKDMNGYLYETIELARQDESVDRMIRFIEPQGNIAPILSRLDLTVIPSRWEACPILPMESLVLGVPVVGTDCLGLREVLRDTPSIVVRKEDPTALAEALIQWIDQPTTTAAKEYVTQARKRFDVKNTAQALLELYKKMET